MPPVLLALSKLPLRNKIGIAVAAVAIFGLAVFTLRLASSPSYTVLSAGLEPAQTGKMTTVLDEQGIAYEMRSNGTSIAVEKSQAAKARVVLAGQGMGTAGGASAQGFELFDKQKLGASDFQQKVTYQRALEGEVARTIEAVQGVTGANVQLVLPEEDMFAKEQSPASAAVMFSTAGDGLDPSAVAGMARLVSSSVKGLKPENVTITDSSGALLWPQGDGAAGGASGATKQAAEARFQRELEANLTAMLVRTLGAGKAQVQVRADLNVDRTTMDQLKYDKKGVPLTKKTDTEKLKGGGAVPAGATAPAGGGAQSDYQRKDETTEFGVNKTVSKTEVAPGKVEKLQVALMVDKKVPGPDFAAVKTAIASAAGIDPKRGDQLEAVQVAFAKEPEAPGAGPVPAGFVGPLKWVGLGILGLVFGFFMLKALKRREGEQITAPPWTNQIQPISIAELEAQTQAMASAPPSRGKDPLSNLDQMVDKEPELVASRVSDWISNQR